MGSLATINIKFKLGLKELSTQMQSAERDLKKIGTAMQGVGAGLSTYVTAPLVALGAKSVQSFDDQAQAIAQVEAGLRSTGGAAGYTSDQLQKIDAALQDNTLFGDEEILKDVTAQLLTFTNIANTQFERTQQVALDLASRLGGDLKSASIQLGKALNDPVANLSALSRSGIQFSKAQKAVINQLVKTNRLADAQDIILTELEKQYGGSAKAAAKAGAGGLKQLGNTISDITEDFGAIIYKGIEPFINKAKELAKYIKGLDDGTKRFIVTVGGVASAIGPVLFGVGGLIKLFPVVVTGFTGITGAVKALNTVMLSNPYAAVAVALGAVAIYALSASNNVIKLTAAQKENNERLKLSNDLNTKANKLISSQKAKVNQLLSVAKNLKVDYKERVAAVKELNQLAPKYLGNLTLEKINTDEAREAVKKYNAVLLKGALAKAAQEKLTEVFKAQIDAEFKANEAAEARRKFEEKNLTQTETQLKTNAVLQEQVKKLDGLEEKAAKKRVAAEKRKVDFLTTVFEENKKYLDLLNGVSTAENKGIDEGIKKGTIAYFEEQISGLEKLKKQFETTPEGVRVLENRIDILRSKIDALNDVRVKVTTVEERLGGDTPELDSVGSVEYYNNEIANLQKLQNQVATTSEVYHGLGRAIAEFELERDIKFDFPTEKLAEADEGVRVFGQNYKEQMDAMNTKSKEMQETATLVANGFANAFEGMSDRFVDSLGAANDGLQGFFKMLAGTIIKIISAMLAQSLAQSIAGATAAGAATGPASIFTTPAFIAQAMSGVFAAFAALPKFENGGVIGGTSYIGDRLMIRANSGELVLNQRQQRNLLAQTNPAVSAADVAVQLMGGFEVEGSKLKLVLDRTNNIQNRNR
ncbi:MAG: hypothetical protein BM557_09530 [Flavobacterium sp. MedPE-SWcel]|uniref:hypothetical protein n=1 Tax=uncultured Flavobacterium sp. TaxID=165435 RepID=UPI00091DC130|nr:hypothetical protein [uncultured Flavobacterium sp.]OIQ16545.1 MAG: hypothetical protein BM557_09530 [Flavobacterium sp. MedPE-SWcel]